MLRKGLKWLRKIQLTIYSILHALILLLATYAWLNLPFDYDAGEEHLTLLSFGKEQFEKTQKYTKDFDSIVFINISYDKVLVPVNDTLGMPAGMIPITDREKLSRFLSIISRRNNQKLVFLDIDFNEEYPQDSILASRMEKTRNLYIPTTTNDQIVETSVRMGAVAARKTLVSGDFFKYPYVFEDKKSIPVKLFEFLDEGKFEKVGWCYFRNEKLAFNSIVPSYYFKQFPKYNADFENNYYDLGTDFLSMEDDAIEQKVKGKIVFVGAFTEYDQHATFLGKMPGILILLNAYYNLKYGNNAISFSMILLFFLIYLFLTIYILKDKTILNASKIREWLARFKVFEFLIRLVSFTVIFIGLSVAINLLFNVYLNILLIGIYFSLFSSLVQTLKKMRANE